MGIFSSPADKYSQIKHYFPLEDFTRIFRSLHIKSVTQDEEDLAKNELDKFRSEDGKISLREIYKVLRSLRNANKISKSDEGNLMNVFEEYFKEHFNQ